MSTDGCPGGYETFTYDYNITRPVPRSVTRCAIGQRYSNGTCVDLTQATCDSGFLNSGQNAVATFDYAHGGACMAGYRPMLSRNYVTRFDNVVVNSVRCPTGQYYLSGTCREYDSAICDAGFGAITNSVLTFIDAYSASCINGYQVLLSRRNISYVEQNSSVRCGFGQYPTTAGCLDNPRAGCPTGHYDVVPSNAFARRVEKTITDDNEEQTTVLECATNYSLYNDAVTTDTDTNLCYMYTDGLSSELCTPLCDIGYTHTGVDTCASGCAIPGMHTLRVSDGRSWPLYAEKSTTPSLNFQLVDSNTGTGTGDICYINLLPGAADGTMNLNDGDGGVYHVTN